MAYVSAIIVAAGGGKRLGAKIPKAFVRINGTRMMEYSLKAYQGAPGVNEIILVIPPTFQFHDLPYFDRFPKLAAMVSGGRERTDSVKAGLKSISGRSDLILIHDAARPLIQVPEIEAVIRMVKKHGAAILAAPVTDTIKQVRSGSITGTLDRSLLWKAQTPQGFKLSVLKRSHFTRNNRSVTDDSQLAEMVKEKVHIVPGGDYNIKVTTPIDLEMASWLLKKRN